MSRKQLEELQQEVDRSQRYLSTVQADLFDASARTEKLRVEVAAAQDALSLARQRVDAALLGRAILREVA